MHALDLIEERDPLKRSLSLYRFASAARLPAELGTRCRIPAAAGGFYPHGRLEHQVLGATTYTRARRILVMRGVAKPKLAGGGLVVSWGGARRPRLRPLRASAGSPRRLEEKLGRASRMRKR
jgi:hypothetical protein